MRSHLLHFLLHHLLPAAAALALCCACAEQIEPSGTLDGPQPLVFSAAQGDLVLSTRAAADGTWDGGEEVAIEVGGEVKKYKVTSSGGALEPADGAAPFYRSDTGDIEVKAWYPYSDSEPAGVSINTDQSTKEGREESNLMTASATAKFGGTTTLTFSHQTALIKVGVTGEDGTAVTGAMVTILGMVKAFEDGGGYYSALVPPCTVNTNGKLLSISVTKDGNTYVYEATPPSVLTFEAGKSYEYSFNLKRSLVTTGGIEVTLSGTELEYTGSTVRPEVTVTYNGTALTEDTDYTLLWGSSTSSAKGNYTVTVKGKGAYIGSVEKSYSIVEAPPYLTFTASGAQTFKMTLPTDADAAAAIGTFEYSVGGGEWTKVTSGKEEDFGGEEGNLRLRGTGLNSAGGESLRGTAYHGGYYSTISFGTTAPVAASGDIRTLINGKEYATVSTSDAKFCYLFKDCTVLTSAPELPATDLASQCYQGLFKGCTKLSTAPVLNATKLASNCYNGMFFGCTSLEATPVLNATTLAPSCYYEMFKGCTSLQTTPALPAETLTSQCYFSMFSGCTSLTTALAMSSAKTLAEYCYTSMFSGCTSLQTAPALPATSLAMSCYTSMFSGCTYLTSAPALPAEELAEHCYQGMFYGCTSLETAPVISAKTLASYCYMGMFQKCTNLTSAPKLPVENLAVRCYYQMFQDCTSLQTAPALPATSLAESCYYKMFSGCTNLNSVTIKATTSSSNYDLKDWLPAFSDGTSNPTGTIYYSDDATYTILTSANAIPSGWTVSKLTN